MTMNNYRNKPPFTVAPNPQRPGKWKVEFAAKFGGGKRVRRFASSQMEAFEIGNDLAAALVERGLSAITESRQQQRSVKSAFADYMSTRGDNATGSHGKHLHRVSALFVAEFGKRAVESISPHDLDRFWMRPEWPHGKSGQRSAYAYLRLIFNWLERYGVISQNPIRRVDPPPIPKPLKNILTPAQMIAALEVARKEFPPMLTAFLTLGGFQGLRTSEILAMTPAALAWDENEIHVADGKTGERYVAMNGNFIRHCPREFDFPNQRNFYKYLSEFVEALEWGEWPANCLRHSAASYHLATCGDAGKTANMLGHSSPKMVRSVYARAVKFSAAKEWGAI